MNEECIGPRNIESILMHSLCGVLPFLTIFYIKYPIKMRIGTNYGYIIMIIEKTESVLNAANEVKPNSIGST